MVSKQIVGIFFRYKTLMSIKWFESVIWLEKMGISSHVLSFLSNAESMTYVLCIKVRRILWKKKKKKQPCWQLFVWSEESSEYYVLGLVISLYIFEYEYRREDRLITFSIKLKRICEFSKGIQ